jgi:hypothetical protein
MPTNHGYTVENEKSKKTLKIPKIDSRILINFFDKNVALGQNRESLLGRGHILKN